MESHTPRANKTVGGYTLVRELGRGGMGTVFEARQASLKRNVAIKIITAKYSSDSEFTKRFEQEARITASIDHPNIVRVIDFGREGGNCYLVMELIEGIPISNLLAKKGALDLQRALHVIHETAQGLKATHAKGVLHRDIKPHNIMVDREGHIKVMDFGLAKAEDATTQMTKTGAMLGTPAYMSPEQCRARSVTAQSDIYSLGVVLFEMLTGRTPFEADNPLALIMQVVQEPFPAPTSINHSLPTSIDALIGNMVAKRPSDRYPSIDALLKDIALLQADTTAELTTPKQFSDLVAPINESEDDLEIPFDLESDLSLFDDFITSTSSSFAPAPVTSTRRVPPVVWTALMGIIIIGIALSLPVWLPEIFSSLLSESEVADNINPAQPSLTAIEPAPLSLFSVNGILGSIGKRYIYRMDDGSQIEYEWPESFETRGETFYPNTFRFWQDTPIEFIHMNWRIREDAVYVYYDMDLSHPGNKFETPLEAGKSWTAEIYHNGIDAGFNKVTTYYYHCEEDTVTVPAGTFRTIRLVCSRNFPANVDDREARVYWFAQDLGMVKFKTPDIVFPVTRMFIGELIRVEDM